MPKSKQQKAQSMSDLSSSLKESKGAVFANFQGLKVSDFEEMRKQARNNQIKVQVAKKTLVKKVFNDLSISADPKSFGGGVVTVSGNDEVSAAKLVAEYAKKYDVIKIFGGLLEGQFTDEAGVKRLASLPSKQELLSKLVGSLNAPVSGFMNALAGNLRNLVGVLNNIKDAKNKA
jgi:large subunit ribosomal protein L10